jgi:RNA polymerase-binding transcription factor DksA
LVLEVILRERLRTLDAPLVGGLAGPDPTDAAQAQEEEWVWMAVLERSQEIRSQVVEALGRLAEGRNGLCAECQEPIPAARLRVLPFAVRCLPCQEWRERGKGKRPAIRSPKGLGPVPYVGGGKEVRKAP